jgi:GTPase SAR1 family protein
MGTVISKTILLVGPSGGGKTTLLYSLKNQRCTTTFDPSGVYNVEKVKYTLNSSRFLFHVFDLPGRSAPAGPHNVVVTCRARAAH